MSDQMRVTVVGASGKMGQQLIRAVLENPETQLTGATERGGHDWIGRDLGTCLGGAENGVIVSDDVLETFAKTDAVLDFTIPAATVAHAAVAAQARAVHVIGTTGMTDADLAKINAAGRHAVVVRAGNMSLGVNLLTELTRKLGDVSDSGRDGITGARKKGDIGFAALRGGDVVGEHDVIFAGAGERLEYSMLDVLGL